MKRNVLASGIALLVWFSASGCGGGAGSDSLIPLNVFLTTEHAFAPKETFAVPNQSVTFKNSDFDVHSVTADSEGGPSSDHDYPEGMMPNDLYTFLVPSDAAPGTQYFFHCRFHGAAGDGTHYGTGMVGVITVR